MTPFEIHDYIHVYSMLSFQDGSNEPGIIVNKYNIVEGKIEYYFIAHADMSVYHSALEKYDVATIAKLSRQVFPDDLSNIRPINLTDYKEILEVHKENIPGSRTNII